MKLTKAEMETIFNYNAADATASIYTHDVSLMSKLMKLAEERPAECRLERMTHGGNAADFTVPKRWIKVNASLILSDEQRAKRAEQMNRNREASKERTKLVENP